METILIVLGIIIIALLAVLVLKINQPKDDGSLHLLQEQMQHLRHAMERSSTDFHKTLHDQGSASNRVMNEVIRELTEVKEGNKEVRSVTEQLQDLQKILTHQKQRGNLGEASLELILSNMLPPGQFELQYRFKDNKVVDAVIHTKDGVIPIDAKYSLDNYQRMMSTSEEEEIAYYQTEFKKDIQKRIDETSAYIKPEEGTLPFAFMFIPAEGIYYDLLINQTSKGAVNTQSLIEYAFHKKKVIIVSPTTFYAYLQTVVFGLRAFKIEESAKHIQERVGELGRHLGVYEEYMRKLGVTFSTSVNHYNTAYKELKKIDKDVFRITDQVVGIDPLLLDKPVFEEE